MWRMLVLSVFASGSWLGAVAQLSSEAEPTSPAIGVEQSIDACLASAQEETSCIGVTISACTANAYTTVDMLGCISPELEVWDQRLNSTYQALIALYAEQDIEESPTRALAPRIRFVQQEWIKWRDAKCGFENDKFRGGTMGRITGMDCHLQETAERALELNDLLREAQF